MVENLAIDALETLRAVVLDRLGLRPTDYEDAAELMDEWIRPGLDAGVAPITIAHNFCKWLKNKHDLAWLTDNANCVICGRVFTNEMRGIGGHRAVCGWRCLSTLRRRVGG